MQGNQHRRLPPQGSACAPPQRNHQYCPCEEEQAEGGAASGICLLPASNVCTASAHISNHTASCSALPPPASPRAARGPKRNATAPVAPSASPPHQALSQRAPPPTAMPSCPSPAQGSKRLAMPHQGRSLPTQRAASTRLKRRALPGSTKEGESRRPWQHGTRQQQRQQQQRGGGRRNGEGKEASRQVLGGSETARGGARAKPRARQRSWARARARAACLHGACEGRGVQRVGAGEVAAGREGCCRDRHGRCHAREPPATHSARHGSAPRRVGAGSGQIRRAGRTLKRGAWRTVHTGASSSLRAGRASRSGLPGEPQRGRQTS